MHGNTLLLFNKYARHYFRPNMRVLEIGPRPPSDIQRAVGDTSIRWESAGIDHSCPVTYVGSAYSYPIESEAADVIVATNVLEHVRKPWVWLRELARICKPGGYVITINPASWPYHENPIDCWRAYPDGMKAVYEEAQLKVVLSLCESLEDAHLRHHIPGRSLRNIYDHSNWKWRTLAKISEILGLPVERPYDTVTIGQK